MKLSGLLFIPIFFTAASSGGPPQVNCGDAKTQFEMNQCAKQAYDSTDKKLNEIYEQVLIKTRNRANTARRDTVLDSGDRLLDSTLIGSQRKWMEYRDSFCKVYQELYHDASMRPVVVLDCMQEITSERIRELKDLLKELCQ